MGLAVNQVRKLRRFESVPAHRAGGRLPGFSPGRGAGGAAKRAHIAQLVEHILGKNEVPGSSPGVGSRSVEGVRGSLQGASLRFAR